MYKNWTRFLLTEGIMCLCKNLIYIKPTRRIDQPECYCSTVNNPVQSGETLKGNNLTTLMEIADGDKHVQDDKHVYNWNSLLDTVDKVCAKHQYQCLPPPTCRNIQQFDLHRRGKRGGKRRKMHLDIIRPWTANQNILVRVNIEVNIGKYQPGKSLAFHYSMHNLSKTKNQPSITK